MDGVRIGEQLGERAVLMGHSTGATLCAWAALGNSRIAAVVLLSPNFGVANRNAKFALYPWGPQLLRLFAGPYRPLQINNDLQR